MEILVIGRNRQNLKTVSFNLRTLSPSISIKTVEDGLSGIQELKTNTPSFGFGQLCFTRHRELRFSQSQIYIRVYIFLF